MKLGSLLESLSKLIAAAFGIEKKTLAVGAFVKLDERAGAVEDRPNM